MKSCLTLALCFAACLATAAAAEPEKKRDATPEEVKARLAEHAKKKADAAAAPAPAPAADPTPAAPAATAPAEAPKAPAEVPANTAANAKDAAKAPTPPTLLPKVEVRNGKITELDRELNKKNREIAREKQATKPTQLDEALNGSKISKALSIFGGQSSDDRSTLAKERVAMMEEEKEIIEAISQAQTKEEKEELQKTLEAMKAMRRELEQSLR